MRSFWYQTLAAAGTSGPRRADRSPKFTSDGRHRRSVRDRSVEKTCLGSMPTRFVARGSSRQAEAAGGAGTSLIIGACHLVGDTGEVKTGLCIDDLSSY
jgi:hypothetical protein